MNVDEYLTQGNERLRDGEAQAARSLFEEAVQKFPTHIRAKERYAFATLQAGLHDDAHELYLALVQKHPKLALGYFGLADLLLQQNRVEEADEVVRQARTDFPDNPTLMEREARLARLTGDLPRSVDLYRTLVEETPDFVPGHIGLGTALQRQGKTAEAAEAFARVPEDPPMADLVDPAVSRQSFASTKFFPTTATQREDVVALIQSMRPVECNKELVRIGDSHGDGDYLLPNDLDGIEACFSPGVGPTSDFEFACAEMGMEIFMADGSVAAPIRNHDSFHFVKKYVGVTDDEETLTFDHWVSTSLPTSSDGDLLLQMDIEGDEYASLLSMSDQLLRRFRVIAIEFHSLDNLWSKPFFDLASKAVRKVLATHECLHIHPNNYVDTFHWNDVAIPPVIEVTFLRKDRIETTSPRTDFPHELDQRNNPRKPEIVLPKEWYLNSAS